MVISRFTSSFPSRDVKENEGRKLMIIPQRSKLDGNGRDWTVRRSVKQNL